MSKKESNDQKMAERGFVDVKHLCESAHSRLGYSKNTIRKYAAEGVFGGEMLGGKRYINHDNAMTMLETGAHRKARARVNADAAERKLSKETKKDTPAAALEMPRADSNDDTLERLVMTATRMSKEGRAFLTEVIAYMFGGKK